MRFCKRDSLSTSPILSLDFIAAFVQLGAALLGIPMLLLPLVNPMVCPTSSWRDLTQERIHHSMQHTAHSTAQHSTGTKTRATREFHEMARATTWRHDNEEHKATTAQHNMTMRSQGHHSTAQHCTVRNIPELQTIL